MVETYQCNMGGNVPQLFEDVFSSQGRKYCMSPIKTEMALMESLGFFANEQKTDQVLDLCS